MAIKFTILSLFFCANVTIADNALLVIGGYDRSQGLLSDVELFGCPDDSVKVPNYPEPVYLASGVFKQDDGSVMVCGGQLCGSDNMCAMGSSCYTWKPKDSAWTKSIDLNKPRYAHQMTYVDKPGATDGSQELVVFGYEYEVDVFVNGEPGKPPSWKHSQNLENRVFGVDCVVNSGDYFYSIINDVERFDLQTGKFRVLSTPPEMLLRPGQCAVTTIGGTPGIMTRFGFWYNLYTRLWEIKSGPHFEGNESNTMFTFNGKPTVFGNSQCDDPERCEHKMLLQYDAKTNKWGKIGELKQPRTYSTVVEVPASFCSASQ